MDNQNPFFPGRTDLSDLQRSIGEVRSEIGRIIVGQDRVVDLLLTAMLSDGHVLIEGVPGVAKTLTAKLLAKTVAVGFSRIQFTPDLMPSDVIGTSVFNQKTSDFEFRPGPIFSNIVLIDEINRAPAKTQSALFESMEERQVTSDGKTYKLNPPFMVVATQNPVEQEGTYRLPEAQLDRFLFKIDITYPSYENEVRIISEFHQRRNVIDLNSIRAVLSAEQITAFREKVYGLHVDANLISYIAQIVNQTRNNSALYLGASPRASLAMLTASKAFAAIRGRDFVTPEDIKFIAEPVLHHRVMLTPEKEMEGVSPAEVIRQIIERVEIPR
ncbi:MAG: ATPase associated with various cellular activities AAA3 [Bacteroidetes bacterium]|nr:MAG: ATPase associated with various cellular activities AAA3 [Bacteroidota bacterium]